MGLFDLFSPPKTAHPAFGDLVYRRGVWNGNLLIPQLHDQPIQLAIDAPKDADLSMFQLPLSCLHDNITTMKKQIADASFEMYEMYVREDRKARNFTDADYAQHPPVTSPRDIWGVLTPFRVSFTSSSDAYNTIVWLDVDWPNPHYFAAYLNNAALYLLDVDG